MQTVASLHLDNVESISDNQFEFRSNRLTIDAIWHLREWVGNGVRDRGVAISLNIANAFNSLGHPLYRIKRYLTISGKSLWIICPIDL